METKDKRQEKNLRKFLGEHSEELNLISRSNVESAWGKIKPFMHQSQSWLWRNVIRYAAVVAIAFLFGVIATNYIEHNPSIQYATVTIPNGQMGNVILPDGTEVSLNSGSTLRYPSRFDAGQRDIWFTGEAYFEVKRDERNPFYVHLENYTVQVTGTAFNVRSYRGLPFETTLVKGKVEILDNKGAGLASLVPGQMFYTANNEMKIRAVKTEVYTMWKDGKLFLDDETLGQISEKLERWYNVEIRFTDEMIKQHKLSGTILKNKPFDQILKILTLKESLDYSIEMRTDEPDVVTFSN